MVSGTWEIMLIVLPQRKVGNESVAVGYSAFQGGLYVFGTYFSASWLFSLVPASTIKQRPSHDQRQALPHSPPAPSPKIAPHSQCPRACTSPAYRPETAR
jgi:hypothetical protein